MHEEKRTKFIQTASGLVLHVRESYSSMEGDSTLPTSAGRKLWKEQAIDLLKKDLKPGSKIFAVLRSVSKTGRKTFALYTFVADESQHKDKDFPYRAHEITVLVARVIGYKVSVNGGILCNSSVSELVELLALRLYPDGSCTSCFACEVL